MVVCHTCNYSRYKTKCRNIFLLRWELNWGCVAPILLIPLPLMGWAFLLVQGRSNDIPWDNVEFPSLTVTLKIAWTT